MTTTTHPDRILLVDDDEGVRTAFSRLVGRSGFAVDVAATCADAVTLCTQRTYGVIALDYAMPEATGFDVHDRLRHLAPDATFGLISAQCDLAMAMQATNDFGFRFVLTKPWHTAELLSVLSRAMEEWWERSAMRKLERQAVMHSSVRAGPLPGATVVEAISAIYRERAPQSLRRAQRLRAVARLAAAQMPLSPSLIADIETAAFIRGALNAGAQWRTETPTAVKAAESRDSVYDALRGFAAHSTVGPLLAALDRGAQTGEPSIELAAQLLLAVDAFDQKVALSLLSPSQAVMKSLDALQSRQELDARAVSALTMVPRETLEQVVATHRDCAFPALAATGT